MQVVGRCAFAGTGHFNNAGTAEFPRPVYYPPGSRVSARTANLTSGKVNQGFLVLEEFV